MQLVEERAPDGFEDVTDVLSRQELEDIAANYKRVAGFQVEGSTPSRRSCSGRAPSDAHVDAGGLRQSGSSGTNDH